MYFSLPCCSSVQNPAAAVVFAFGTEPLRPQTALFPLLCSLFSLLLMLLLAAVVDPDAVAFVVFCTTVLSLKNSQD